MPKVFYISGRISGTNIDRTKERFYEKHYELLNMFNADRVVNPFDLNKGDYDNTWEFYMKECIKRLCDCTHIYMLDGFEYSRGAVAELIVAKWLGIEVMFESNNINWGMVRVTQSKLTLGTEEILKQS